VIARIEMESALNDLGIEPAVSQSNFCWFALPEDGPDEAEVVKGMAERGVLIRGGTGQGQAGFLRVTYGTPRDNDRFIAALTDVLGVR
jgi:histidinol-phosphate aminotransferase